MKLKSLIASAESMATTTKTASHTPTKTSNIASAIDEALAQAEAVKTASEARSPSADLEKMASEIALGQRDAEVGHAEKIGAAMADSFVRQLAAYETAAHNMAMEKAASMEITAEEVEMIREARENPEAFIAKVASAIDSSDEDETLTEKQASEIWENTAQETVRGIHKVAMDHYAAGYATIADALEG
jgi:hypothetical protein